jgi:hypothetical protein
MTGNIHLIVTENCTRRVALTLLDCPIKTDKGRHYIVLPNVATCDGYRGILRDGDDWVADIQANEAGAIFRHHCKHPDLTRVKLA